MFDDNAIGFFIFNICWKLLKFNVQNPSVISKCNFCSYGRFGITVKWNNLKDSGRIKIKKKLMIHVNQNVWCVFPNVKHSKVALRCQYWSTGVKKIWDWLIKRTGNTFANLIWKSYQVKTELICPSFFSMRPPPAGEMCMVHTMGRQWIDG